MVPIDLSKIPNWLLAIGVFVISLAVIWVFVIPGKGIEWNASYYGPYRFVAVFDEKEQSKLKALADSISEVDGPRICFRKSNWDTTDCLESGNVATFFDNKGGGSGVLELAPKELVDRSKELLDDSDSLRKK